MATISIYDHATGETTVRDMNEAELAELAYQAELAVEAQLEEDRIAAERAEAKAALLERLGITEDEAKLLLG
jgi:urease accessory protein UreE